MTFPMPIQEPSTHGPKHSLSLKISLFEQCLVNTSDCFINGKTSCCTSNFSISVRLQVGKISLMVYKLLGGPHFYALGSLEPDTSRYVKDFTQALCNHAGINRGANLNRSCIVRELLQAIFNRAFIFRSLTKRLYVRTQNPTTIEVSNRFTFKQITRINI